MYTVGCAGLCNCTLITITIATFLHYLILFAIFNDVIPETPDKLLEPSNPAGFGTWAAWQMISICLKLQIVLRWRPFEGVIWRATIRYDDTRFGQNLWLVRYCSSVFWTWQVDANFSVSRLTVRTCGTRGQARTWRVSRRHRFILVKWRETVQSVLFPIPFSILLSFRAFETQSILTWWNFNRRKLPEPRKWRPSGTQSQKSDVSVKWIYQLLPKHSQIIDYVNEKLGGPLRQVRACVALEWELVVPGNPFWGLLNHVEKHGSSTLNRPSYFAGSQIVSPFSINLTQ